MNPLKLKILDLGNLRETDYSVSKNGNELKSILIKPPDAKDPKDGIEILPDHAPGIFSLSPDTELELRYTERNGADFSYSETKKVSLAGKGTLFISPEKDATKVEINLLINEINLES